MGTNVELSEDASYGECYKLRCKRTGLYMTTGHRRTKAGKTWSRIGHLKNHLNIPHNKTFYTREGLENFEVVQYVFIQDAKNVRDLSEVYNIS